MAINNKRSNSHSDFVIMNKILPKSKRSQVTIFIILALLLVAVLVILFVGKERLTSLLVQESPITQIKKCVQDSVKQGLDILSVQGGVIKPDNYYFYQGNNVEYLCYTNEYYEACTMQKPMLKNSIERELTDYSKPRILACMNAVKSSLEKKGYSVSFKDPQLSIELIPNNIMITIDSDLKISKAETESYKSFKTDIPSKIYDLIMTADSILSWEVAYGDSEITSYMMYYPSLKVEKKKQSDGTKIYILTDRNSLERFLFASRSAVKAPGIIG